MSSSIWVLSNTLYYYLNKYNIAISCDISDLAQWCNGDIFIMENMGRIFSLPSNPAIINKVRLSAWNNLSLRSSTCLVLEDVEEKVFITIIKSDATDCLPPNSSPQNDVVKSPEKPSRTPLQLQSCQHQVNHNSILCTELFTDNAACPD
jgi:hypothetical protein